MTPLIIELTDELDGPIDLVWRSITDWERQGDWQLEASDFVVCTPHREGVGVEAEATVRVGGITTRDRIRVDVWEPPTHLGILHLGWVGGRGDLQLTAVGPQSTRVDWREELHPPLGPLGAFGIRVFAPLMRRAFARDLRALAGIVERRADGRYPEY